MVIRFLIAWLALLAPLAAQHQTISAHINEQGREVTLNLFHFSEKRLESKVSTGSQKLGDVLDRDGEMAGVSIGQGKGEPSHGVHLDVKNGKITLSEKHSDTSIMVGPYLIKNGAAILKFADTHHDRRTFLLHDGSSRWILGYAPVMSRQQLAYALEWILKQEKAKFVSAVELTHGLQSGFWVNRGDDLHLYLKELKPAPGILSVKMARQN